MDADDPERTRSQHSALRRGIEPALLERLAPVVAEPSLTGPDVTRAAIALLNEAAEQHLRQGRVRLAQRLLELADGLR